MSKKSAVLVTLVHCDVGGYAFYTEFLGCYYLLVGVIL